MSPTGSVNRSVGLWITRIWRVREIWNQVFFKLRVSFDGLVSRKRVFLEYSNHTETHIDVVVDVIELHISVDFEFCLDEDLYNFGELISFLRVHMPPVFVYFSSSNGGVFLLARTKVVGSWVFGESILYGKEVWLWPRILLISYLISENSKSYFFSFLLRSSQSCLSSSVAFLLVSIEDCMTSIW